MLPIWANGGCFNDFYIYVIDNACCMKNASETGVRVWAERGDMVPVFTGNSRPKPERPADQVARRLDFNSWASCHSARILPCCKQPAPAVPYATGMLGS